LAKRLETGVLWERDAGRGRRLADAYCWDRLAFQYDRMLEDVDSR